MRILLTLTKGERVKYLSHRDYIRAFEMALRRSRLPIAYSEGFNPRPRLSFGLAIGVGVTSEDEKIAIDLIDSLPLPEIAERLNAALPPDIRVTEAREIPEGTKSPISALNASRFRITVCCEGSEAESAITALLDSEQVKITRKRERETKTVDIRPSIRAAASTPCSGGWADIEVVLRLGETGGAGPQDFLQALRTWLPNLRVRSIHRVEQFHSD
mgnify:CR=1 FL=1